MLIATALRSVVVVGAAMIAAGPAGAQSGPDVSPQDRRVALPAVERNPAVDVAEIEVAFDVQRGRPGGTAVVRAQLRDAAGRPADGALRLEADGGSVEPPLRVGPGLYTAKVELPTVLGPRRVVLVYAAVGRTAASATLPLAPGPAASLRVEATGEMPADGTDHSLWIGVSDEHGNASAEAPRAHARRGTVGAPVALASGGWMIPYRPPRDARAGEDVVRIVAGTASVSKTLRLVPMEPRLSVGARGGVVLGTGGTVPALGGEAVTWLDVGGLDLGLALAVTGWFAESDATVQAPGGALTLASRRAWLPATLALAARLRLGSRAVATFSLGGGGAMVTSRTRLAGEAAVSELGWAPVATAGVELALRVQSSEPLLGIQGFWIGDPHLDTLRGSAWPVSMYVGYRFHAF